MIILISHPGMLNSYNFISFKQQWPMSSRVLLAYLLLPLQMSPDLQSKQPGWPLCTFKRKISARETVVACISSLTIPVSQCFTQVLKTDPSMDNNINEQLPAPETIALLPDCMRQEYKLTLAKVAGDKEGFSYTRIYQAHLKSGRSNRTYLQERLSNHVKGLQL